MKRVVLALVGALFISLTACDNAASKIKSEGEDVAESNAASLDAVDSPDGAPVFVFNEESFQFGEIPEGTVAKHDFVFKNTGDAPLIITNASGSCGCTVPNWPREPIAPGEEGTIHVEFNSNGRAGNQTKQVTIKANTVPNTKVLTINAQVQPKAQPEGEAAAANG